MRCRLVFGILTVSAAQIPSRYAINMTVYHVDSYSEGVIPFDMDTADAAGDIFFDFRSKALPIECAHPGRHPSSDCQNAEVTSSDLVITKLKLEVDSRFGKYGKCNECINGSAGASHVHNCTDGQYICSCGDWSYEPCSSAVGYENVTEAFSKYPSRCQKDSPEWSCWRSNVIKKTHGIWYSTVSKGYCGDGSSSSTKPCTWRVVEVSKVVNKSCSDNSVYNYVETYDAEATSCFKQCSDSGIGIKRNTSSHCWIGCFYRVVLGPDAGKPDGTVTGMPLQDLLIAWEKAFIASDVGEGGCPGMKPGYGKCWQLDASGSSMPTNQICSRDVECEKGYCNPVISPSSTASEVIV